MRSIYDTGITHLSSGQIICVSYLRVGVDGKHDGVVIVLLHLIMSHDRSRSIRQRSHQNVFAHFSIDVRTPEFFRENDQRATP
jgi:hypothetical protein